MPLIKEVVINVCIDLVMSESEVVASKDNNGGIDDENITPVDGMAKFDETRSSSVELKRPKLTSLNGGTCVEMSVELVSVGIEGGYEDVTYMNEDDVVMTVDGDTSNAVDDDTNGMMRFWHNSPV